MGPAAVRTRRRSRRWRLRQTGVTSAVRHERVAAGLEEPRAKNPPPAKDPQALFLQPLLRQELLLHQSGHLGIVLLLRPSGLQPVCLLPNPKAPGTPSIRPTITIPRDPARQIGSAIHGKSARLGSWNSKEVIGELCRLAPHSRASSWGLVWQPM